MGIYIRVDVDKPYGHKNLFTKILSKFSENFFSIYIDRFYLNGLIQLLEELNAQKIIAHFYFRNCTIPNKKVKELLERGSHKIGFHAENTKTEDTFINELQNFENKIEEKVIHFTKHGSGNLKLGKYHYPTFEPLKYQIWAKKHNLIYLFGNETLIKVLKNTPIFHSKMFWLETWYRNKSFSKIETLISESKKNDYVALIHPSNYETHLSVQTEFKNLIQLIKNNNITVKTIG